MNNDLINIVIISYNCRGLTINCIESIRNTLENYNYIITVVDNASSDDTVSFLKEHHPDIHLIVNEKNMGYAAAVNAGARSCDSDFLILSNADVIYHPGAIEYLIEFLNTYRTVGVIGPQQLFPDGSWQNSNGKLPGIKLGLANLFFLSSLGRFFNKLGRKIFHPEFPQKADYIDGAVMAVRKEVFDDVGGFDEDYFFYTEEADFCYKLNMAYKTNYTVRKATVTHLRGAASENRGMSEKSIEMLIGSKVLFCKKHLKKTESKFYIRCEINYTRNLIFIWKILALFLPGKFREKSKIKTDTLKIFVKSWKKELKNYE